MRQHQGKQSDMRKSPTKRIEAYRTTEGPLASTASDGANGQFRIPYPDLVEWGMQQVFLTVIASGADEDILWEHVSVSLPARCPTWAEMDYVKKIFWRDDEAVMQLHVPAALKVNTHENCLHLWRPIRATIPLPPQKAV